MNNDLLKHPDHETLVNRVTLYRPSVVANTFLFLLLMLFSLSGYAANNTAEEIKWDDLVPADYRADAILDKYGNFDDLSDDDPRIIEIMKELEAAFAAAPIVESLDGKTIKLPGFVVPLEGDGDKVSEFLLVPYFGACIHEPPPPANQTIFVRVPTGDAKIRNAFDTVWVTGTLSAKSFSSDLATAGYQIEANSVEPYEE